MPKRDQSNIEGIESSAKSKAYWRNAEHEKGSDATKNWTEDEFPHRGSLLDIDRRDFVKLLGASTIMAGLVGCRSLPTERIVSYSKQPEGQVPGISQFYASCFTMGGYAYGILVESREGRPGKIEGSPIHPATLGSSNHWMQASLYDMYDPDRTKAVFKQNTPNSWDEFMHDVRKKLDRNPGESLRILTGTVTSPTLIRQITRLIELHPGVRWHQYEPFNDDNSMAGANQAFGVTCQPVYDFAKANVVVSFDSDFLFSGPAHVRHAQEFSAKRNLASTESSMSRHYAFYSNATPSSLSADHRWPMQPSKVGNVAFAILDVIKGNPASGEHAKEIAAIVADLQANRGKSIVVAGEQMPAEFHAAVFAINQALGNIGQTMRMVERITAGDESQRTSITSLATDMMTGKVKSLLILGTNVCLTAPNSTNFKEALKKVDWTAYLGTHMDDTMRSCSWQLPESHSLESWGDARAFDGTATLQQPLIRPLYDSRSSIEVVDLFLRNSRSGRELLQETYASSLGTNGEKAWDQWLHDGIVPGFESKTLAVTASGIVAESTSMAGDIEAVILPDPNVFDGRFSNNAWLQELPKPISQLAWDNAVHVSPATAKTLGVADEELVEVTVGGKSVRGPIFGIPGMADGTVVLHMGYGRTEGGTIASGTSASMPDVRNKMADVATLGFDVSPVWNGESLAGPAQITKIGGKYGLVSTQIHHLMMPGDEEKTPLIVRSGTLEEFHSNPSLVAEHEHKFPDDQTFYSFTDEEGEGQPYKWGMSIDLSLCIGCNACTIACQAENNIPTVGKEQMSRGRELHWIRVDRYSSGNQENPDDFVFQPVPCMHCENAPCEPVCPVAATTHSKEGLNQMVYNRCVGTRYCSNNCPYKVRRFNFLNFGDKVDKPSLILLNNPDVTVRGRGVMEKCTYCVQRINKARIDAKKEDRTIGGDEVVTACQAACPSKAIVFGNLADPKSQVSKQHKNSRNYMLLKELNTRPRTTYLGKVRNVNPVITPTKTEEHGSH